MTAATPKPGDTFVLDGNVIEITVVSRREQTVCGIVLTTLDSFGNYDRVHDVPWTTVWGQQWACGYTEDGDQ